MSGIGRVTTKARLEQTRTGPERNLQNQRQSLVTTESNGNRGYLFDFTFYAAFRRWPALCCDRREGSIVTNLHRIFYFTERGALDLRVYRSRLHLDGLHPTASSCVLLVYTFKNAAGQWHILDVFTSKRGFDLL